MLYLLLRSIRSINYNPELWTSCVDEYKKKKKKKKKKKEKKKGKKIVR